MKLIFLALLAVCAGCVGMPSEKSASKPLNKEEMAGFARKSELMHDAQIRAKFAATDTNSDGVWDRAEMVAESKKMFQTISSVINSDKSGKLRHELKTAGPIATEADYLAHNAATVFGLADKNGNGVITLDEYIIWAKAGAKR